MSGARWCLPLAALLLTMACTRSGSGSVSRTRNVVYGHAGARDLHLDIEQPNPPLPRMPAVVHIHGGGFAFGSYHGRDNLALAALGFFCINVEYRLSGEAKWPAQIHDCKAAIRWLRANAERYHIDPERIGVWGESAGGHLAAMVGTSGDVPSLEGDSGSPGLSSKVACVVDRYGPTNFLAMVGQPGSQKHEAADSFESKLLGRPLPEVPELVRQADPCHWVTAACPPFLIQHGTKDMAVPFGQSELLADALGKVGVSVTLRRVEGADHGFGGATRAVLQQLDRELAEFFCRHLSEGRPPRG